MYTIPISASNPTWLELEQVIRKRIKDLTDEALSLRVDDRARLIAAARVDELILLLSGPTDTLSASIAQYQQKLSDTGTGAY